LHFQRRVRRVMTEFATGSAPTPALLKSGARVRRKLPARNFRTNVPMWVPCGVRDDVFLVNLLGSARELSELSLRPLFLTVFRSSSLPRVGLTHIETGYHLKVMEVEGVEGNTRAGRKRGDQTVEEPDAMA
jgi:hypothetical protein